MSKVYVFWGRNKKEHAHELPINAGTALPTTLAAPVGVVFFVPAGAWYCQPLAILLLWVEVRAWTVVMVSYTEVVTDDLAGRRSGSWGKGIVDNLEGAVIFFMVHAHHNMRALGGGDSFSSTLQVCCGLCHGCDSIACSSQDPPRTVGWVSVLEDGDGFLIDGMFPVSASTAMDLAMAVTGTFRPPGRD